MQTRYLAIPLAGILALSSAAVANAANKFWKNSVVTGNWNTSNNWSAISAADGDDGGVPIATNTVRVSPTDGLAHTVTYNYVGAPVTLESLRVDLTGAGTARTTFEMSANNLTAGSVIVGDFGRATFNHSGGTVSVNNPFLDAVVGFNAGGDGIYNLSNTGVLSVARALYVGGFGPSGPLAGSVGVFNQTGSSMNTVAGYLVLGSVAGSTGTYSISNTASLTAADGLVGSLGMGTLNINDQASVHFNNSLSINNQSSINLNGGTLRFSSASGLDRVNFNSGTVKIAGSQFLLNNPYVETLFGTDPVIPSLKELFIEGTAVVQSSPKTMKVEGGSLKIQSGLQVGSAVVSPNGDGKLEVTGGGKLEVTGDGLLGGDIPSDPNGVITVSDAGSQMNTYWLYVGYTGRGILLIDNGGSVVTNGNGIMAYNPGTVGSATVSGAGSTWNVTGALGVGNFGTATLNIQDHALVYVGSLLDINSLSTINLQGGTLRFDTVNGLNRINYSAGTIQLAGDRSLGSDSTIQQFFGNAPTITTGKGLTVEETATLLTTTTINGGTFTAKGLVGGSNLKLQHGTFNLTDQPLTIGMGQMLGATLDLASDMTVNVTQGIANQGLVTGDGEIGGPFTNAAAGELRAEPGRSLKLTGDNNTNAGQINLYGGMLEFTQDLTNNSGAFISGNGTLKATGGLTNLGTMNFSGQGNVVGDVANSVGGKIISSGGGPTTFFDDVINNGEIRTSTNGFTVFFGDVSGGGTFTGTGTVNFEGDLSPGSSPAAVSFGGDVVLGPAAVLTIELGGTTLGTYDQILVAGDLVLDGLLDVSILPGFTPGAGQSFDILDWGTIDGEFFDVNLPTLAGLTWNTSQLYATGVLSLAAAGLLGDYNNNGTIDAADYTAWRDALTAGATSLTNDPTPGIVDESDFAYWRAHFGDTLGSGAGSAAAVPEPSTLVILLVGMLVMSFHRRAACRSAGALILAALLGWLGEAGPVHAQGTTSTIALTGQSAPGAGGATFFFFSGGPTLNGAGKSAFLGKLTGGTVTEGIFSDSGGSLINIALEGQSAPGGGGAGTLFGFAQPAVDESGTVVFNAGIQSGNSTKGIYKGSGGSLTPIVLQSQSAPGAGAGTFAGFLFSALNDGGTAVLQAGVTGGTATEGIFSGSGGSLTDIALQGQIAPGTGGGTFVSFSVPELNAGGTAAIKGEVTGGTASRGIFSGSGGSLTAIAVTGQSAPGTGAGTLLTVSSFCALNDSGTAAFTAGVTGGTATEGIFEGSGGSLTNIALQGQSAPGAGAGGFSTFRTPALNDSGTAAFVANVTGGSATSGIFKGSGGSLTNIALQGQSAPGTGAGTFSSFNDPALINTNGTAAFLANITGGTGSQGIFVGDGVSLVPVAVVGQSLAGSTITGLTFVNGGPDGGPDSGGRSGFNEFGQVAYHAVLADGKRGMFLFNPADPLTSTSGGAASRNTKFISGMGYVQFTATTDPGNLGTTVNLLGGTVGSGGAGTYGLNRDVNISFIPPNPILPVSDILTLTGIESDTFVLQLSYDETAANSLLGGEANARLGWMDGGDWVLAVDGNSAGTPTFVDGAWNAGYSLGYYGVDISTNVVWAVLNHSSDFTVIGVPEPSLLGDYNGNDVIDAADYTVWRDALTAGATSLTNDPTPGTVDESDFLYWRAHFGESLGSGAGSAGASPSPTAVPEPATAFMAGSVLLLGLFSGVLRRPRL